MPSIRPIRRPSTAPAKAEGLSGKADSATRPCEWPGCRNAGDFRAPRSRDRLNSYYWFCLDHVRQYNAAWNYYDGMSDDEVEADIRGDTVWNRPTWPMGTRESPFDSGVLQDAFGLFERARREEAARKKARTPWEKALEVLGLVPPVTVAMVKARYKELVKRHHPDANGGSKSAEEKFKQINHAYHLVMGSLAS